MARIKGSVDNPDIPYSESESYIYLKYPTPYNPDDVDLSHSLQKLNPNIAEHDGHYCQRQLINTFSIHAIYEYALHYNQLEHFTNVGIGIFSLTPHQMNLT